MHCWRLGSLVLVLLALAVAAPASAATCKNWQMRGHTFWIDQSDGFSVQITPGRLMSETEGHIKFGTNGSLTYERETGIFNQNTERARGSFVQGISFAKANAGYVTFRVYWDGGMQGSYHGNVHNPRYHDGALIADFKGWIQADRSNFNPTWTSRQTPLYCRSADVVPDVDPRTVPPITLKFPEPTPPPPPPKRIIGHGGRGRSVPADPNKIGQFDLPFESESSLGGKFDVKFEVYGATGSPRLFKVRGTLTNTDIGPQYNGTFDGTMPYNDTKTVTLSYRQPGANAHGTVVFRFSEDGETFTGDGMHMGHTPFQWTGRRKHGPN